MLSASSPQQPGPIAAELRAGSGSSEPALIVDFIPKESFTVNLILSDSQMQARN